MKKSNEWMKGFRTILWSLFWYVVMYLDVLITNVSGLSNESLKGAAIMALLITIKQIKTDVIPKLRGNLKK